MRRVTIQGKEYAYRYDFAAQLYYEQLTAKAEQAGLGLTPAATTARMHYACLLSGDEFELGFEEFTRAVDTRVVADALNAAFEAEQARWDSMSPEASEDGEDSKKK